MHPFSYKQIIQSLNNAFLLFDSCNSSREIKTYFFNGNDSPFDTSYLTIVRTPKVSYITITLAPFGSIQIIFSELNLSFRKHSNNGIIELELIIPRNDIPDLDDDNIKMILTYGKPIQMFDEIYINKALFVLDGIIFDFIKQNAEKDKISLERIRSYDNQQIN